jgi:hypothetical protein
VAGALAGPVGPASAAQATIKVAFWNVMSGKGVDALPGHAAPFHNTPNCTDATQPLNAWGVGASQAALQQALSDPSVVALGLAEAWSSVCASPEHVRAALGWKAASSEENGVALVARYGFAGPEQWQQLDTSLNTAPADTAWVLRVPVCLDAACTQSMPIYSGHWYGTGTNWQVSYDRQAQQTVAFLNATSGGGPHVFVGDLNTFEGSAPVCGQSPNNTSLGYLRSAGYLDAWLMVHGGAEGYTGMADRAGCGVPEGYTWKRIDYAWTPPAYQPVDIQRWAMNPPGDASPSDHYAIIVTLPYPNAGTTSGGGTTNTGGSTTGAPVWTSLVNAAAQGAVLQKISSCGTCFDAGAIGTQTIGSGGSIQFAVGAGQRLYAGLSSDQSSSTSYLIDYAFCFWPTGVVEIREKNVYRTEGVYTASDTFSIAIQGTTAIYAKNGTPIYTSAVPVANPMVFDTSLASIGATVQNLAPGGSSSTTGGSTGTSGAATGNVVWTNLVNAVSAGSSLQKTSGCGSCFDAGAVSQQQVGDGTGVSFSVAAGQRLYVGLGHDTSASTSYLIDYAFNFWPSGLFEIRENNVYRTEGAYAATDVFRVALNGTTVTYYKNGTPVYTSRVAASAPLFVDTSMNTIGATISSAVVK